MKRASLNAPTLLRRFSRDRRRIPLSEITRRIARWTIPCFRLAKLRPPLRIANRFVSRLAATLILLPYGVRWLNVAHRFCSNVWYYCWRFHIGRLNSLARRVFPERYSGSHQYSDTMGLRSLPFCKMKPSDDEFAFVSSLHFPNAIHFVLKFVLRRISWNCELNCEEMTLAFVFRKKSATLISVRLGLIRKFN